ncbi:protein NBR1 homolog [Silene latifolia]|uniref:protein NBR1 homolog n=1 Tax=Silene latifolia TaxID=37657 RepID=UPI003D771C32
MASLVIKVKYEETLRRFNVAINGDGRLDLSMNSLWLKICSLFKLPSDSGFRLTYKDEDDDLITLVDDDDLHDVVRQGLNPVRITVHHLISDQKPPSSSAHPSGTSQNLDSVKIVNSVNNWPFLNDMVKEPKLEAGVLSHENATVSNSTVVNEKIDGIEKRSEVVGVSVKPPLCPSIPVDKSKRSSYKSPSSKWSKSKRLSYKSKYAPGNKNKDILALKREYFAELLKSDEELTSNAAKKAAGFQSPNRNSDKTDNITTIVHTGISCDICRLQPISGPRFKSKMKYDYDLCQGCFLRVGNEMEYCRIDVPLTYQHLDRAHDVMLN